MSSNSLTSSFNLGVQTAHAAEAATYNTALATVSALNVEFDEQEPRLEHPSTVARSTAVKTAPLRKSAGTMLEATFALYPNFLGTVLRGLGMGVSSVDGTGFYTHTFTIALDAACPYLSAMHKMVGTSASLERKALNVQLSQLSIEAGLDEIMCSITGEGDAEANSAGTETKAAETAIELSTLTGTYTPIIGADTSTAYVHGSHTFTIDNALKSKQRRLWSAAYSPIVRESIGASGTLSGIDIDADTYEYYQNIQRGGSGGTAVSLTPATGSMAFNYKSAGVIGVTAAYYSLTVTLPSVYWTLANFQSSGNELIRCDATYTMVDNVATPLTIVLVNNVAGYPLP